MPHVQISSYLSLNLLNSIFLIENQAVAIEGPEQEISEDIRGLRWLLRVSV